MSVDFEKPQKDMGSMYFKKCILQKYSGMLKDENSKSGASWAGNSRRRRL